MWKYTHTDEMYHSLTSRNDSTELFHSDTYLGQDFSDGIKHWKYVKKKMVNGRWRYYYSDAEYETAKKKYNTTKTIRNKAIQTVADNELEKKTRKYEYEKDGKIRNYEKIHLKALDKKGQIASAALQKANEAHKKTRDEYMNVKIKTAPRRIVAKGLAAVGNGVSYIQSLKKKKKK